MFDAGLTAGDSLPVATKQALIGAAESFTKTTVQPGIGGKGHQRLTHVGWQKRLLACC